MPKATYILTNGLARTVQVAVGDSVMQGAVNNDIEGIQAECGGSLTCATCHVHVDEGWYGRFPAPDKAESDLLEVVDNGRPTSRLSCQLIMREDCDGLVVAVAPTL